jgi:hypothetical protein
MPMTPWTTTMSSLIATSPGDSCSVFLFFLKLLLLENNAKDNGRLWQL